MPQTADQIWADGPSVVPFQPPKPEIRKWGKWVEGIIAAFLGNSGLVYSSRDSLFADLAHPANSSAWVIGDATVAYNGVYVKSGASGSGSWMRVSDLPFSFIIATDTGAGTPNAIQATTSIPVSGSALIWMNIADTNTGSPVTVQFNNGPILTLRTNTGNNIAAGGLVAGMVVLGIVTGSTFRLLNDQVSSAIVAAAEAAQAAAEAAQAAAEAASHYQADVTGAPTRLTTDKIKELPISLEDCGYTGGNALAAFNKALASGKPILLGPKTYQVTGDLDIVVNTAVHLVGYGFGLSAIKFSGYTRGIKIQQDDYRHPTHIYDVELLAADAKSSVVTISIASPGVVSWAGHGLQNGDAVKFSTTGALPTGLVAGTTYYVVSSAANTFSVAATSGGGGINTSGTQSGVHTAIPQDVGVALDISYAAADSIGNRNVPRCLIKDVSAYGADITTSGWAKGILLTNVHRATISRPQVTGRRNLLATGVAQFKNMKSGIEIVGSYPPTFSAIPSDIIIDCPRIDQGLNGIKSIGEVEGLVINSPVLVAVDAGVDASYSTKRPWVKVNGGHINCFSFGVHLVNAPQSTISDMVIYKYQDTVNDTVAVSLDGCDDASAKNLTLINLCADKAVNGEWNAVVGKDSARLDISDIRHNAPSKTVILSGTTTLSKTSKLTPNGTYTNATVQTYDDSSSGSNEYSAGNQIVDVKTNAGAVSLTVNTPGAVVQSITFSVNKGEKYSISGNVIATKGATAGQFLTQLARTGGGGAVATFGASASTVTERSDTAASATVAHCVTGVMTVTASGTITIQVVCTPTGSGATVNAGDAQLTVVRL